MCSVFAEWPAPIGTATTSTTRSPGLANLPSTSRRSMSTSMRVERRRLRRQDRLHAPIERQPAIDVLLRREHHQARFGAVFRHQARHAARLGDAGDDAGVHLPRSDDGGLGDGVGRGGEIERGCVEARLEARRCLDLFDDARHRAHRERAGTCPTPSRPRASARPCRRAPRWRRRWPRRASAARW